MTKQALPTFQATFDGRYVVVTDTEQQLPAGGVYSTGGAAAGRAAAILMFKSPSCATWGVWGLRGDLTAARREAARWTAGGVKVHGSTCPPMPMVAVEVAR